MIRKFLQEITDESHYEKTCFKSLLTEKTGFKPLQTEKTGFKPLQT